MSLGIRFPIAGVDESTGFIGKLVDPYKFVSRYACWLPSWKAITPPEAQQDADEGWWIVLNWEYAGTGLAATGVDQAAIGVEAARQAKLLGVPTAAQCQNWGSRARGVYFSADEQVPSSAFPLVYANLMARQAAMGGAYEAGCYGQADLIDYLASRGVFYLWQANAWNPTPGYRSPHALLVQLLEQPTLNGVQCDGDEAYVEDFGQWQPNKVPFPKTPAPPTHEGRVLVPSPTLPARSVALDPTSAGGYWIMTGHAQVYNFGGAPEISIKDAVLSSGESAAALRAVKGETGAGLLILDSKGGVHTFGEALWYGSPKADGLAIDAVDLTLSPDQKGYAVLDSEGGLHQYGDFHWAGSLKTPV